MKEKKVFIMSDCGNDSLGTFIEGIKEAVYCAVNGANCRRGGA